jgi:hypothetical protein
MGLFGKSSEQIEKEDKEFYTSIAEHFCNTLNLRLDNRVMFFSDYYLELRFKVIGYPFFICIPKLNKGEVYTEEKFNEYFNKSKRKYELEMFREQISTPEGLTEFIKQVK